MVDVFRYAWLLAKFQSDVAQPIRRSSVWKIHRTTYEYQYQKPPIIREVSYVNRNFVLKLFSIGTLSIVLKSTGTARPEREDTFESATTLVDNVQSRLYWVLARVRGEVESARRLTK